jgi:hypothetical protein
LGNSGCRSQSISAAAKNNLDLAAKDFAYVKTHPEKGELSARDRYNAIKARLKELMQEL